MFLPLSKLHWAKSAWLYDKGFEWYPIGWWQLSATYITQASRKGSFETLILAGCIPLESNEGALNSIQIWEAGSHVTKPIQFF